MGDKMKENKWVKRDKKRAKARKMRVVGKSVQLLQQLAGKRARALVVRQG